MNDRHLGRAILRTGLGGLISLVMLYFAFRGLSLEAMGALLERVDYRWVAAAMLGYAADLTLRTLRWHYLLGGIGRIGRAEVGEALVVGYAWNNLLPARLGELVRADYLKQRFGLGRSAVLGSIMVERLMDLVTVVACLTLGLWLLPKSDHAQSTALLDRMADLAVLIAVLVLAALILILRGHIPFRRFLPARLDALIADLATGLEALRRSIGAFPVLLDLALWSLETATILAMVAATGVTLAPAEALVLIGAASLSTLVPTAPGFLGSYQLIFALCLELFGKPRMAGIVAATLIQVFLLGTLTLVGLGIHAIRSVQRLRPKRVA
jgi:uncharacterized protein (TIRG00374 family)